MEKTLLHSVMALFDKSSLLKRHFQLQDHSSAVSNMLSLHNTAKVYEMYLHISHGSSWSVHVKLNITPETSINTIWTEPIN